MWLWESSGGLPWAYRRFKASVRRQRSIAGLVAALAVLPFLFGAQSKDRSPALREVTVDDGIELHYLERGTGVPVVFVHGSLSFGGYWSDELAAFSAHDRAIAYSRRYNFPNTNPIRPGYSAIVDADDLAQLIQRLGLGRAHVIGHSYGALAALFLAARHPELVRSLVLAEAPAVSLLGHLPGTQAEIGKATLADIQARMVLPMEEAFRKGETEAGIRAFMAYVFDDPRAWDKMSESSRRDTLKNAREWDAMLATGKLFPDLEPATVRRIGVPVLLLSGEKSYPFLNLIDQELTRLLRRSQRIVIPRATHQMWLEQPDVCRKAVFDFFQSVKESDQPTPSVTNLVLSLAGWP